MSKKLTIQSVNAAHQAAADANTKANELREALRARIIADQRLAASLVITIGAIKAQLDGSPMCNAPAEHRSQLEPTANSYGYTLADHPTRRDLVVVQPLEN